MPKESLTITLGATRRADLDRAARSQGRDRDSVIDEALRNWLDLQAWHVQEIEAGLRDAGAGDFVSEAEVEAAYGRR